MLPHVNVWSVLISASLVRGMAAEMQPLFDDKDLRLNVSVPSKPILMQADPDGLRRVLAILLDNALKYSYPGGEVALTVENGAEGIASLCLITAAVSRRNRSPGYLIAFIGSTRLATGKLVDTDLGYPSHSRSLALTRAKSWQRASLARAVAFASNCRVLQSNGRLDLSPVA